MDQSADASNENATEQKAEAGSHAVQVLPINSNLDVDIANHGDDGRKKGCGCHDRGHADPGDVRQSNENESGDAFGGNWNGTHQSNEQTQQAHGGKAESGDARGGDAGSGCGCHEKKKAHKKAWSHEKRWHDGCCRRDGGDGGDATSAADASVEQDADASNDNRTWQSARARSKAVQFFPLNAARGFPPLHGPRPNGQRR